MIHLDTKKAQGGDSLLNNQHWLFSVWGQRVLAGH